MNKRSFLAVYQKCAYIHGMSVLYHVATGKGRFFRFAPDKRAAIASGEYVIQKPPGSSGRPGRPKRGEASPDAARLAEMAA